MKLLQLRYFMEVCKTKSITQAAKNFFISQPSITVAIKGLEEELGIDLFNRIKKRMYLTKEGDYFFQKISKMIENLDDLTEVMKDFGNQKRSVKVGVPPMTASFILPKIFAGFQKEYPEINLEIFEYGALESSKLLREEKIDLGIMVMPENSNDNHKFNLMMKTSYRFFVHKNHPFIHKKVIGFEDIKDEPLILFNSGFYINELVMENFAKIGVEKPNIILKTGQVNTVKRFITEGLAVGFLIQNCIHSLDEFIEVPFEVKMPVNIGIQWKEKEYLPDNVAKLINYINEKNEEKV